MDLFDYMRETNKEKESPLASRMRPVTLDEVVGQKHIIGKDKLLYRAIKADKLSSLIFYGPPGTGKGDRTYNQRRVQTDQCDSCRKERYGRSSERSKRSAGNVWKKDDSFY